MQGNIIKVECDGAGYGLGVMLCGDEYGTDSANSGLDTIKTIIEDNSNGIVDAWTNNVLGDTVGPTASGYSYTTQIETIAGTIGYIYFPYKPCTKAINDVCDIVQAIKGTNAGPHWIVDTSNRVLLTTIGAHATPADSYWKTYWNITSEASTLTEGKDFTKFRFNTLSKEANYVLYHGPMVKPLVPDIWSNNNSANWGVNAYLAKADDAVDYQVGTHSISLTTQNYDGPPKKHAVAYYPSSMDLGLNINAMGGEYTAPTFHAWAMMDAAFYADTDNDYCFAFFTSATDFYYTVDQYGAGPTRRMFGNSDEWVEFTFPVGSNWNLQPSNLPKWIWGFNRVGTPSWTNINAVGVDFFFGNNGLEGWIDGVYLGGSVQRAARQVVAYTAADPCKIKLITDSVAKDDTLNAADDSGLIGRLLYAEYLRSSSTPTVGSFTTKDMIPNLLPGQLIPLEAKKRVDGTYKIDDTFRALRVIHNIVGNSYSTTVEVTDDLKNANPRPVPSQYNALLGAVRPETQDRQASSIKLRDIDITQSILEKSY